MQQRHLESLELHATAQQMRQCEGIDGGRCDRLLGAVEFVQNRLLRSLQCELIRLLDGNLRLMFRTFGMMAVRNMLEGNWCKRAPAQSAPKIRLLTMKVDLHDLRKAMEAPRLPAMASVR